ncbi:MAG: hypothetical protein AMXMBFR84_17000 [Candidatus Hydrogenedentota bacterium]
MTGPRPVRRLFAVACTLAAVCIPVSPAADPPIAATESHTGTPMPSPPDQAPKDAVILSRDDDSAEHWVKVGDSLPAVEFEAPESKRHVIAVYLFASRDAHPIHDRDTVQLRILNQKRQTLLTLDFPATAIKGPEPAWYTFSTPAVEVPEMFFIALKCNPSTGIRLGIDENPSSGFNSITLPLDGFDKEHRQFEIWMIRVCVRDIPPETGQIRSLKDWVAPETEFVKALQARDPAITQVAEGIVTTPITSEYALATVSVNRTETKVLPEERTVMGLFAMKTGSNQPWLLMDVLTRYRTTEKGYGELHGYDLDHLTHTSATFVITDDFYGIPQGKIRYFFNLEQQQLIGKKEYPWGFNCLASTRFQDAYYCAGVISDRSWKESAPHGILKVTVDSDSVQPEFIQTIDGQPVPRLTAVDIAGNALVFSGPAAACVLEDGAWRLEKNPREIGIAPGRTTKDTSIGPRGGFEIVLPSMSGQQTILLPEENRPKPINAQQPDSMKMLVVDMSMKEDHDKLTPGILLIQGDSLSFHELPPPEYSLLETKRPQYTAVARPGKKEYRYTIQCDIGAYAVYGNEVIFGTSFYDGEGTTGIGALGYFNLDTKTYRVDYLDELIPYSTTAIHVDRDAIWLGTANRPEGEDVSAGLWRIDRKSNHAQHVNVPKVISKIDSTDHGMVLSTKDGLYHLTGTQLTRISVTTTLDGKLEVYTQPEPSAASRPSQQ